MKHGSGSTLSRRNTSLRTRRTLAARVALSAALACSGVAVAQQCKQVSGTFTLVPLTSCPAGTACFQGTFGGDLSGTSISGLTGLQPTPEQAGVVKFTARSMITVESGGTINTTDIGVGTRCTGLVGPCASSHEVLTIISGTAPYAQAHGTIILSGPYMSGDLKNSLGAYQGHICTGKPKPDPD
jgi:hypothetical protein